MAISDRDGHRGVEQHRDDLGRPRSADPERARHRVARQRPDGVRLTQPGTVVVEVPPVEDLAVLTGRGAHRSLARRRPRAPSAPAPTEST